MEHPQDTEQRLTELKIEASFAEDLLAQGEAFDERRGANARRPESPSS